MTNTPTEIQKAYSRGYAAGRAKRKQDLRQRSLELQREEFRRKAFLAALPFAMSAQGWSYDGRAINNSDERLAFADRLARHAVAKYF